LEGLKEEEEEGKVPRELRGSKKIESFCSRLSSIACQSSWNWQLTFSPFFTFLGDLYF